LKLTQTQLGKKIGDNISKHYVARYETGETDLTLEILYRFARALDVAPTDLLPSDKVKPAQINQDILGALIEECLLWRSEQDDNLSADLIAKTVAHLYPEAVNEKGGRLPSPDSFLSFLSKIEKH